jgi:hypothetical protein
VAFLKSTSGFLADRTANTIAAAVTNQIPVVSIRDAITALSHACKLPGCSGTSIGSERKGGIGSFVAMGDASALKCKNRAPGISFFLFLLTGTLAIEA